MTGAIVNGVTWFIIALLILWAGACLGFGYASFLAWDDDREGRIEGDLLWTRAHLGMKFGLALLIVVIVGCVFRFGLTLVFK
jgi:hypothetical protein